MAKIVSISKYPPLEGGISSRTYWLVKALRERGHELRVITDRVDVSEEYRVAGELSSTEEEHVWRPAGEIPWHIPNDSHRAIDLLNVVLRGIGEKGVDVIDTGYLIPYGIVGYLASMATGVPFVIRHGGSDLAKFLRKSVWSELLHKTISAASLVITDRENLDLFLGLNPRSVAIPPYVPDPRYFNPDNRPILEKPVLALIGKANFYWRHKAWDRAIGLMQLLGLNYRRIVISQGIGVNDFRSYVREKLADTIDFAAFIHPNKMPEILRSISAVFCFEDSLPFPAFSNIVIETLCCGSTVITDNPHLVDSIEESGIKVDDLPGAIIILTSEGQPLDCRAIESKIRTPNKEYSSSVTHNKAYTSYIDANERLLLSAKRR
jgi:glycosyltransferase involved in cell wall biosynthesis